MQRRTEHKESVVCFDIKHKRITHIDQSKAQRGQKTLQSGVPSLGEDGGRVKGHDVGARELLCRHGDAATDDATAKTRDGEQLGDAAEECRPAKRLVLLYDLAVCIVLCTQCGQPVLGVKRRCLDSPCPGLPAARCYAAARTSQTSRNIAASSAASEEILLDRCQPCRPCPTLSLSFFLFSHRLLRSFRHQPTRTDPDESQDGDGRHISSRKLKAPGETADAVKDEIGAEATGRERGELLWPPAHICHQNTTLT